MEILPREELCGAAGAEMEMDRAVESDIQHFECGNNMISAHYGIPEESSDEDDCNVHDEKEDDSCCVCGQHFPFLDHLMEHLKTHRDMLCCHLCMANFTRAVSLAIHLKCAHPKYQPFCKVCRVPFRGTWHLNEHLEKHQQKVTALKKVKKMKNIKAYVRKKRMEDVFKHPIISNSRHSGFLDDHSYCAPVDLRLCTVASEIQTEEKNCFIMMSQDIITVSVKEEQDDIPNSLYHSEPQYEEKYKIPGENEKSDSVEEDDLPAGDTEYTGEDLSSESQFSTGYNKKAKGDIFNQSIISNSSDSRFLHDHSYCAPVDLRSCTVASEIQTEDKNSPIIMSQDIKNVIIKEEPSDIPSSSCPQYQSEPPYEEKYKLPGENESTGSAEEDNLPAGDTEYFPDENLSSDTRCSAGCDNNDFESSSHSSHRKTQRRDECGSEKEKTSFANSSLNAVESSREIIELQTDSSKSTFVIKEMNVNRCENKPAFVCCMCKEICENKNSLLKHIAEKHPTAVYICACCLKAFPKQDAFKSHICWNKITGQMNVLLATTVPQVPVVNLSHGDGQRISPAPVLGLKPVEIKMIPQLPPQSITPAEVSLKSTDSQKTFVPTVPSVANITQTVMTLPQTAVQTQAKLVGNISPLGPSKLTDSQPQAVTVPQTLVRPHCPPSVSLACPNVPVCSPSIQRPSLPNQTRMTLRIPPPLQTQTNSVFVSFSPTVNFSAPILVTANSNKSIPAPRPTFATNIRPIQIAGNVNIRPIQLAGNANIRPFQLAGNVGPFPFHGNVRHLHFHAGNIRPLLLPKNVRPVLLPKNVRPVHLSGNAPVPSTSCPTLVSAILQDQPQVSSHISPGQLQVPTSDPLKIVAMFENKSNHLAVQKQLKQTWRSKTIFPCRHCGAISRQPSLRVRHRYLHRGSRLYRCQCGRSFQRLIHLLRHQVQHAESVRFLCARCGRTFEGAHKLSRHKQESWLKHGRYAKTKCTEAFDCTCGQVFARPSALLWHMLKNTKHVKNTMIK